MRTLIQTVALLTAAATASACAASSDAPLQSGVTPIAGDPAPDAGPSICETGEQRLAYFNSTTDEFGYGIAVCTQKGEGETDDKVAIVLSGEGGNLRTECFASQCNGVIGFERYTRYRFTELTLTWMTETGEHRLVEVFNAEDLEAEPESLVSHFWAGAEAEGGNGETMRASEAPLTLMQLEDSLAGL